MLMCSEDETCRRLGKLALAGPSRGGLGVLLYKASRPLLNERIPGSGGPSASGENGAGPARFASGADDADWLSLSSSGDKHGAGNEDVNCLEPDPARLCS